MKLNATVIVVVVVVIVVIVIAVVVVIVVAIVGVFIIIDANVASSNCHLLCVKMNSNLYDA